MTQDKEWGWSHVNKRKVGTRTGHEGPEGEQS